MINEYAALRGILQHGGYKILEALWLEQISKIEASRDNAAKRGNESAWRYWAGQEKGFKLAMTAVHRAISDMEKEHANLEQEDKIEKMLEEIRPK